MGEPSELGKLLTEIGKCCPFACKFGEKKDGPECRWYVHGLVESVRTAVSAAREEALEEVIVVMRTHVLPLHHASFDMEVLENKIRALKRRSP